MSEQRSSFVPFFPALGLVFGAGAGLLACAVTGTSLVVGLLAGAAAGLLVGSAARPLIQRASKRP